MSTSTTTITCRSVYAMTRKEERGFWGRGLGANLLDILLGDQTSCLSCDNKETVRFQLCPSCLEELEAVDKKNILDGSLRNEEDFIVYSAYFYNNFLKDMYAPYKFEKQSYYRDSFGAMLTAYALREKDFRDYAWLTLVPMSREKEILRGYNPLGELVRYMALQLDLPLVHTLKKVKKNKEQNKLNRVQRERNVLGAFGLDTKKDQVRMEVPAGQKFIHKQISLDELAQTKGILVDDFLTSGNTMREAISVLRSADLDVVGLTLAMSSYPKD